MKSKPEDIDALVGAMRQLGRVLEDQERAAREWLEENPQQCGELAARWVDGDSNVAFELMGHADDRLRAK
jgi:hypothetical protein